MSWNVAGTDDYGSDRSFNRRIMSANTRRASTLRRSVLTADTKASRKLYSVESEHFRMSLHYYADPVRMAKALKGLEGSGARQNQITFDGEGGAILDGQVRGMDRGVGWNGSLSTPIWADAREKLAREADDHCGPGFGRRIREAR